MWGENSLHSRGEDEKALKGIMFTGTSSTGLKKRQIMSEKVYFYRIKNFMNFLEKEISSKEEE